MSTLVKAALIGGFLLAWQTADAREWISRDGKYRVEAELLAVEEDQVVLRRQDGTVIRVPLDRLSYSDVKYVSEALQASTTVSSIVAGSDTAQAPSTGAVGPGMPPLTDPEIAGWQVVPDPTRDGYDLKPDVSVEINVGSGTRSTYVLFPSVPSPFVMLGEASSDSIRQVWDLRTGEVSGSLKADFDKHDAAALSSDGQHFALVNTRNRVKIQIWSLTSGEVVRTIKPPGKRSSIRMVDFAGPNRIVFGDSSADAYFVFDIHSGEETCRIDTEPVESRRSYAVSPGGSYLATYFRSDQLFEVHDMRNGARAGKLSVQQENA